MADLFADTAGWANIVDPTQPYHVQAAARYPQARQQAQNLVTTNYVLTELVALLTSPLRIPRPSIVGFVEGLKASPYVDVVQIDVALDAQAWQLVTERQDKAWSLVDCSSFVVMRSRGIREALTSDHHFDQAGYLRLLKS
jgi:predicted nucleic acid-binding protein